MGRGGISWGKGPLGRGEEKKVVAEEGINLGPPSLPLGGVRVCSSLVGMGLG